MSKDECAEANKEHINRFKMAHMIGVAEYMRERAVDYGINPDVAYTLGLLHDIGYLQGRAGHEEAGADILNTMGMDSDYVNAIIYHGENPYELLKEIPRDDFATPEYVLLIEADMSVNARGYRVGFEKRLEDIGHRYGYDHPAYKTSQDNIRFIKEYQAEHGIGKPVKLYHKHSHSIDNDER